ncbi:MAG TPA: alkaline phosphatase family protein [Candidatus Koribacter sp.]
MEPSGAQGPGLGGTTQSPVKRVIILVFQNHSFDAMFATFPGVQNPLNTTSHGYSQTSASGTGTVTSYLLTDPNPADMPHGYSYYDDSIDGGKMDGFAMAEKTNVAMGHYDNTIAGVDTFWNYATQFALADNFFQPVVATEPNLALYMVSAADTGDRFGEQPSYGPCNKSDPTAHPLTNQNVGDEMNSAAVTWAWFQEELNPPVCGQYVATENPFQYFTSTQNSANMQDITTFYSELDNGTLPSVSFVNPGGGHNCHPGNDSITTCAAYFDKLIQRIQNSPVWPDTAVIVYFDEGGGFYDHVPPPTVGGISDGIRIPMMVISPLGKTGYISHVQMDNVSILRFIQWNWGLPNLNARNAAPGSTIEMRDMFTF